MSENDLPERKLTPTQLKAIEALLDGRSQQEAAAAAGVTDRTVRRWLREDVLFGEKLESLSRGGVFTAAVRLSGGMDIAIGILLDVLKDSESKDMARLRAAGMVLDTALKLREQYDVLARLEQLEDRLIAHEAINR